MGKKHLVIISSSKISISRGRVLVEKGNEKFSFPLKQVEGIIILGEVSLTSKVINKLLKEKIPAFFLSRYGNFKGVIYSDFFPSNLSPRLYQYEAYRNRRLDIAKFLIQEKIKSIEECFNISLAEAKRNVEACKNLNSLLGVEGNVSQLMFKEFKKRLKADFEFEMRMYNPPKDEVNSLLSFYYTFHYCLSIPMILSSGYDPYISFLHVKRGKHASFASDIIEPLRPFLTVQILNALNTSIFSPDDFEADGRGVYLKKEAFKKFLNLFEKNKEANLKKIKEVLNKISEV